MSIYYDFSIEGGETASDNGFPDSYSGAFNQPEEIKLKN